MIEMLWMVLLIMDDGCRYPQPIYYRSQAACHARVVQYREDEPQFRYVCLAMVPGP